MIEKVLLTHTDPANWSLILPKPSSIVASASRLSSKLTLVSSGAADATVCSSTVRFTHTTGTFTAALVVSPAPVLVEEAFLTTRMSHARSFSRGRATRLAFADSRHTSSFEVMT